MHIRILCNSFLNHPLNVIGVISYLDVVAIEIFTVYEIEVHIIPTRKSKIKRILTIGAYTALH